MTRPQVTDETLLKTIEALTHGVAKKLEKHGRGKYISKHESLGIITEEYWELIEAVKGNDGQRVGEELIDVAVGCIFALASMMTEDSSVDTTPTKSTVDVAAERARELMIERANKSGIIISSMDQFT